MKLIISVVVCLLFIYVSPQSQYTNKYDNINIDMILSNERVLTNYIKCLMDEGPCTPEGRELKKTLPDALEGGCQKCNNKQKEYAEKVIKHLMKKRNRDWVRLEKKYDPQGLYRKQYTTIKPN